MAGERGTGSAGSRRDEVYRQALADPARFWGDIAAGLHWSRPWHRVLGTDPVAPGWFAGGRTNLCYNALDRHVIAGRGDVPALVWECPAQGLYRAYTYAGLLEQVGHFAAVLLGLGVRPGDRVAIYLPMLPEAVIAMLACARIGAVHVVVFTGFGVEALAKRIRHSGARLLITADAGLRRTLVLPLKQTADRALEMAPVERVVVVDRGLAEMEMVPRRDHRWDDLMAARKGVGAEAVPLESGWPSYIIYTPGEEHLNGVVRDTGGYMVALDNSMRQVFGVHQGDVFWAASDVGWVVGHSYTVYGPLLAGVTSFMYEGTPDYPDHGLMWRLVEKHRVNVMLSAPTAMRMLRRFGVEHARRCDLSSLRHLFLAGEVLDVPTWEWTARALPGCNVIDHYWLTETGTPVTANLAGVGLLPVKPGSANLAVPGYDLAVVDGDGRELPADTPGYLVIRPPLPPGSMLTLWGEDERYRRDYWERFPGGPVFATGDYAVADEEGYLTVLGRADGVINVAAHRLGLREIEEVIGRHPAVAEVGVIGVADTIKGEDPAAFIVLREGVAPSSGLKLEIKARLRQALGAVAVTKRVHFVPWLPRSGDGRLLRRVLKAASERRPPEGICLQEPGVGRDEMQRLYRETRRMLEAGQGGPEE